MKITKRKFFGIALFAYVGKFLFKIQPCPVSSLKMENVARVRNIPNDIEYFHLKTIDQIKSGMCVDADGDQWRFLRPDDSDKNKFGHLWVIKSLKRKNEPEQLLCLLGSEAYLHKWTFFWLKC